MRFGESFGTNMLTKREVCVLGGLILSNVACCLAKDVCYRSNNNIEVYCEDGYYCCRNNTRCCSEGISIGAIIGITLGAIFVLAICSAGAMMMMKKKNAPRTRVGESNNVHNVQNISVINPPPYSQQSAQPPGYSASTGNHSASPGNYFAINQPQAPPPYAASYQPPPAYSTT